MNKRIDPQRAATKREVLQLHCDGKKVPEIAAITGKSERSAKRMVDWWRDKLQARDAALIATRAVELGLVSHQDIPETVTKFAKEFLASLPILLLCFSMGFAPARTTEQPIKRERIVRIAKVRESVFQQSIFGVAA